MTPTVRTYIRVRTYMCAYVYMRVNVLFMLEMPHVTSKDIIFYLNHTLTYITVHMDDE